jgi:tripartite-type tricarboxylate transporter receptor subunit TctC
MRQDPRCRFLRWESERSSAHSISQRRPTRRRFRRYASRPFSESYIRAGRLRALAVTAATRSEVLPGIPTVGEFVPDYEASTWYGVGAPKATPAEIVEKLNKEINAGLADPNMKTRLADLGGTVLAGSPADFGKLIAEETEKWGKVVSFTGIKAD